VPEPSPLPLPARAPLLREVLLVAWGKGWLAPPAGLRRGAVGGLPLVGDGTDHTQRKMLCGSYEPPIAAAARRLLRPGDLVVDVGAHIGWFSVLAAGLVGPSGAVRSYEPFPSSWRLLERNVADLPQVVAANVALGAESGTLRLGPQPGSDSGSVSAVAGDGAGGIEVPVATLDHLLADDEVAGRPVRLLKVDVEGFEPAVVAGAPEVLARTEAVLYEVNRPALAALGSSEQQLHAAFSSAGFDQQAEVTEVGLRRLKGPQPVVNVLARRRPSAAEGGRAAPAST
jgi:FkbM family methyltransferase